MLRKLLPFKITANNLLGHEIKHELLLDDLRGFRFSVKTDSLLGTPRAPPTLDPLKQLDRNPRSIVGGSRKPREVPMAQPRDGLDLV